MGKSPEIELVRRAWTAMTEGAPEVLGECWRLMPDGME